MSWRRMPWSRRPRQAIGRLPARSLEKPPPSPIRALGRANRRSKVINHSLSAPPRSDVDGAAIHQFDRHDDHFGGWAGLAAALQPGPRVDPTDILGGPGPDGTEEQVRLLDGQPALAHEEPDGPAGLECPGENNNELPGLPAEAHAAVHRLERSPASGPLTSWTKGSRRWPVCRVNCVRDLPPGRRTRCQGRRCEPAGESASRDRRQPPDPGVSDPGD